MVEETEERIDFWLRLDNAAKIYPAIKDRELTSVFRISVELKERIKAKQLLEAVQAVDKRFPYFKVKLRAGFFWYYLEPDDQPIAVVVDEGVPCRAFGKNEVLFRILAKENRISVEFSHILTDGRGAFEFLRTLLLVYFQKCNVPLPEDIQFLRPEEIPSPEEYEDAYSRHFKKINSSITQGQTAFHLPFRLKKTPRFSVLMAIIPVKDMLEKAKEHGLSLTEYLVAIYLYSLQKIYQQSASKRRKTKIIRIEVPVNLRNIYDSKTMRNFSLYVLPEIDLNLGQYSFEEITKVVYHQMRLETDKKLISKIIARNVSAERNQFIRKMPLFIKSIFLARLYKQGTKQYSGVVSNVGKIDLCPEVAGHVRKFIFIPPPPNKILKVNCAASGFDDQLILTFGNITKSNELERQFLTFLIGEGISIKITS